MTMEPNAVETSDDPITHTRDRMSARPQPIEVIVRGERRRRWSLEQKQAIVAESLSGQSSSTAIARKHAIGTGQLYTWRHQLLGRRSDAGACFARVDPIEEPRPRIDPVAASGRIEIVLPSGASVRVDAQVNELALRRVLAALDGR